MKLVITGGSGFIGRALCRALEQDGHALVVLSRSARPSPRPSTRFVQWTPPNSGPWEQELDGADGLVHLAGESVIAKRWSAAQKRRIVESRIDATNALVNAVIKAKRRPIVLVSASAIGYYGPHGDEPLSEESPPGDDFLAQVCKQWEQAAQAAEAVGMRVVRVRIGTVLARDGGALAKMLPVFRLGLGGPLGSGRQWMSWIHREDLVRLVQWALTHERAVGALNATAPNPVRMREFARALGRALRRPAVLPVPGIAVRTLVGEAANLLLTGQRVLPDAATRLGFAFRYPVLDDALKACMASS